jgi:hypothetical protein
VRERPVIRVGEHLPDLDVIAVLGFGRDHLEQAVGEDSMIAASAEFSNTYPIRRLTVEETVNV